MSFTVLLEEKLQDQGIAKGYHRSLRRRRIRRAAGIVAAVGLASGGLLVLALHIAIRAEL